MARSGEGEITVAELAVVQADLYRLIRDYFQATDALEIDPPLLGDFAVTDVNLQNLAVRSPLANTRFLQTSPEYFLKRLLAEIRRDIYSITHAFRDEPDGVRHLAEFRMLEWYRVGIDEFELIEDVRRLLAKVEPDWHFKMFTYRQLFENHLNTNPHTASCEALNRLVAEQTSYQGRLEFDQALDLLMAEVIEPQLPPGAVFITDYPACQAALARIQLNDEGIQIARRFELYVNGLELANGYWELTDPEEQRRRFERDNRSRIDRGLSAVEPDPQLLHALERGLPDCAGVAMGLDRLLMCILDQGSIAKTQLEWLLSER